MSRRIAIGDIHGCHQTLMQLLEVEIAIEEQDELYFLGDYVNKGPSSRAVLDYLIELWQNGTNTRFIRGNHDQFLLDYLLGSLSQDILVAKGGKSTLHEFDNLNKEEKDKYIQFLDQLEHFIELDDFWLVHAGFNVEADRPFEDRFRMLNLKQFNYTAAFLKNKRVIHGHIPTELELIKDKIETQNFYELSLDSGVAYPFVGMGYLSALDLGSQHLYHSKCIDNL